MESEFATTYPPSPASSFAARDAGGQPDRRRSQRQPYRAAAWLSPEAETRGGKQRQVYVTDLSLHGVGFMASSPLEIEAVHWIVVGAGALRAQQPHPRRHLPALS